MSAADKMDPARGWLYVEDLLAADDAERVQKLGDAEVLEEVRASGRDPRALPSASELVARVTARATAPDAAKGWAYVEGLPSEDAKLAQDVARLEAMSDDDVHREIREAGGDPARVPTADELLAKVQARARREQNGHAAAVAKPVQPKSAEAGPAEPKPAPRATLRPARRVRPVWLVAAVLGGMSGLFAAMNGAAIADILRGQPIQPGDAWIPWRRPSLEEQAAPVRARAFQACREERWTECAALLDEAKGIDPDGESGVRVTEARKAIADQGGVPHKGAKGPKDLK